MSILRDESATRRPPQGGDPGGQPRSRPTPTPCSTDGRRDRPQRVRQVMVDLGDDRSARAAAGARRVLPRRADAAQERAGGHRTRRPPGPQTRPAAASVAAHATSHGRAATTTARPSSSCTRPRPTSWPASWPANVRRPSPWCSPTSRASRRAAVLVRLPPALQVEVIRRLVDLEETDPEILREVERGLQARLSQQVPMQRRRVAGLAAVDGHPQGGRQPRRPCRFSTTWPRYDRTLAERLGPPPLDVRRPGPTSTTTRSTALFEAAEPGAGAVGRWSARAGVDRPRAAAGCRRRGRPRAARTRPSGTDPA